MREAVVASALSLFAVDELPIVALARAVRCLSISADAFLWSL
jgi:hypothetical protein